VPELPDVEGFRRFFDEHAARRTVRSVHHVDRSMVRSGTSPQAIGRALAGRRLAPARRHGKLLVCPAGERRLVLHFGMTGTFVWCASGEPGHPHDRLVLEFSGGELRYRNMRRFGGIWLLNEAGADELVGRLGPDWLDVSRPAFDALVSGRRRAIKATLMDQEIAAGLGNLTADESLWQARIDPRRPAGSLDGSERRRLYAAIRKVLRDSIPYGLVPSLSGWLTSVRGERDATCPRCGAELRRVTIGGRTTVFCPREQG
jgi:formamidopyrimidine-DNA glycosylase